MPPTRGDKIFVIGLTVAMLIGFIAIFFRSIEFWNSIPGDLDPAGRVPMVLGILGMLVLAAVIIGVYFRGRRQEIKDAEEEERRDQKP
jgi:hypothetical protein